MGDAEIVKFLLDTCAFIWAISAPDKLPKKTAELIQHQQAEIFVSAITCGEIACLVQRNRIEIDRHWKIWFNTFIEKNSWEVIDINLKIIQEAYSLPEGFHQDPADRIIVATARLYDLSIITSDKKILNYPHCENYWE